MRSFSQNVIKHKVGLLNLATELGNVSRACKVMGFSRDTFYRYQSAMQAGGVDALIDASRKKPNLKNRVDEATESAVMAFALEQPAYGQVRVSNELRKRGIFISGSGVRSIWPRNDLESFKKRLANLERHVAKSGDVLTEAQVAALERKQDDDIEHGEIETAHPGYLGSQDTFYVGTIDKRRRQDLPADLRRYVLQMGRSQAIHDQDADHIGRYAQRQSPAVLRRARHGCDPHQLWLELASWSQLRNHPSWRSGVHPT